MNITDFKVASVDEETEKKLLGLQGKFLRGEKRRLLLESKLVDYTINLHRNSGYSFTKEEIDKIKFAHDPLYRRKLIEKIHKDSDKEYSYAVSKCESVIASLERLKRKEIEKINKDRWLCEYENFQYNITEGKVMINGSTARFYDIRGAAVNINESQRVVASEEGEKKKHVSIGGAVVGGLVFGAVGAAVGAATLGKRSHYTNAETDTIPTANRVSVVVDINGFQNEIILLDHKVDQDSDEFKLAIKEAQKIISKLQYLSTYPVCDSYIEVENEPVVVEIQRQLTEAYIKLQLAKENIPTYEIPSYYLMESGDSKICLTSMEEDEENAVGCDVDATVSICSRCGAIVETSDKFCGKCGNRLQ